MSDNVNDQIQRILGYGLDEAIDLHDHLAWLLEPATNELILLGAVKMQIRILAEDQDKYLRLVALKPGQE